MSKVLKNTTASPITVTDTGVTIPTLSNYTIPAQDYLLWASSSDAVSYIGSGDILVNDGSFDLSISDGIDLIKGIFPTDALAVPTIVNSTITLADTEYSYVIPSGAREFSLRVRNDSILKIAYTSGQSGTNYVTVYPGMTYRRDKLRRSSSLTIYYRSSKSGEVLELEYWT